MRFPTTPTHCTSIPPAHPSFSISSPTLPSFAPGTCPSVLLLLVVLVGGLEPLDEGLGLGLDAGVHAREPLLDGLLLDDVGLVEG